MDKARYAFAFAADLQKYAAEHYIKIAHFRVDEKYGHDLLSVSFVIPRPDRLEEEDSKKEEVDSNEV